MTQTELEFQFQLKQIVWAKLANQPWWPATIVHTLPEKNPNIFQVHFFLDNSQQPNYPRSCNLQSQQLLDFQYGFAHLLFDQHLETNFVLKNSIQLAKAAFQKNKRSFCQSENQHQCFSETQPNHADSYEESKFQLKSGIENCRKTQILQINQSQISNEKTYLSCNIQNIDENNVIEIINSRDFKQLKNSKGYTNRKNVLALQLKFKQILLSKYNLSHISNKNQPSRLKQQKSQIVKSNRIVIKQKNQKKVTKTNIFAKSAKKLYNILRKQLNYSPLQAKNKIIESYQNLCENSSDNQLRQSLDDKNSRVVSLFYTKLIKDMKRKGKQQLGHRVSKIQTNNKVGQYDMCSSEDKFLQI